MTHYNSFDSKIQGEEFNAVSDAESDEVMQLMAEENKALARRCHEGTQPRDAMSMHKRQVLMP